MTQGNTPRIYPAWRQAREKGEKQLALLIDPAKIEQQQLQHTLALATDHAVDFIFVGGSFLTRPAMNTLLPEIRRMTPVPLVLFPGNALQINPAADAILLLSMISGRNPELLIGQHVIAAPLLRASGLEIISCGYLLIDGGSRSAVEYMSGTTPIPADQPDIAASTALAGTMLGLGSIYLEAGSGARNPVPADTIRAVSGTVSVPLIVGGGIGAASQAATAWKAGADLVVVGNAIEKQPELIRELGAARHD